MRLEAQFTNPEAAAALIAAKLAVEELAEDHPHIPEIAEVKGLLQEAFDGLDLAVMHDARRSVQLPRP